jgi:[ribosomal protein S18]-alanine N-acetyltransferase
MDQVIAFEKEASSTILQWIQSPEELMNWTSRNDYPLEDIHVFDKWHSDPDIEAFQLIHDGEIQGYGELWCEIDEPWAELARLIIAPEARGKGLGKFLVQELSGMIKSKGFTEVWVRVSPSNRVALCCYESAGFSHISSEENRKFNSSERLEYLWMKKFT